MLVIRLSRTGRNKYPTYRIVAADSKRAATGKFVMILGHYNPHTKELVIKHDETVKYLSNGAQPSNAVIKLLKQNKIDVPEWVVLKTRNRPAKKEAPITATPATEAEAIEEVIDQAAEPVAEAPVATETTTESVAEVAQERADAVAAEAPVDNQAETAADVAASAETAEAVEEASAPTSDK